ncbi:MAG: efflux RND transporter permease subunit, partial [Gammaproteobacteria bacterium]|nr:efflux RND transporter permease subunit [Gammaproteobacteria bacterium]
IPFSVLFATLAMGYFGISANLMSLGGLAIAIGMMVDGAIVMAENVDRLLHETDPDEPRHRTVARACREVARPILFAITIVVIVFLPLFTLQGVEGKTFRPLAYTVALAMFGSLLFAVIAAPVFADLFMRRRKAWREQQASGKGSLLAREPIIVRVLLYFYRPMLHFFVRQRWLAVLLAVGMLAVGLRVFPLLGMEF